MITRRTLFGILAAPAIIRTAGLLMPVKSFIIEPPARALLWAYGPSRRAELLHWKDDILATNRTGAWYSPEGQPIVLTVDPYTQGTGFRYA